MLLDDVELPEGAVDMTGFSVDLDALPEVVRDLQETQKEIASILRDARDMKPGELTALDATTGRVKEMLTEQAIGEQGSLTMACTQLMDAVTKEIENYEAMIKQYHITEEGNAADLRPLDREA